MINDKQGEIKNSIIYSVHTGYAMHECLRYAVTENWIPALLGISLYEMGELDAWLENNKS